MMKKFTEVKANLQQVQRKVQHKVQQRTAKAGRGAASGSATVQGPFPALCTADASSSTKGIAFSARLRRTLSPRTGAALVSCIALHATVVLCTAALRVLHSCASCGHALVSTCCACGVCHVHCCCLWPRQLSLTD